MLRLAIPDLPALSTFAQRLAPRLGAGDVLALQGGLGAGKTTFARALIGALLSSENIDVPSPTYTLVQIYEGAGQGFEPAQTQGQSFPIFHFDLYRLKSPEEVLELGWEDTARGLCLIEWPLNAGAFLPAWRLDMTFSVDENDPLNEARTLLLEPRNKAWQERLQSLL